MSPLVQVVYNGATGLWYATGGPSVLSATADGALTHGFQVTPANTGYTAYYDPTLGRNLQLSDLTVHSTVMSMSDLTTAGGTISKRYFQAGLIPDLNNVTVTGCLIDGSIDNASHESNVYTLNWCTIDKTGTATDYALGSWTYTAYRCQIGGGSDGLRANGAVYATECYIRTKAQSVADHNDGMQNYKGGSGNTIVRCNIDCRPVNAATIAGGPNAALMSADGATGNEVWTDNFLAGGGYTMRMYENCTYNIQGNWILDGSWTYGAVERAVIPQSNLTWGTVRENRIVNASGATVSVIGVP